MSMHRYITCSNSHLCRIEIHVRKTRLLHIISLQMNSIKIENMYIEKVRSFVGDRTDSGVKQKKLFYFILLYLE